MNIVLFGFKCCGKSTSGALVAQKLNRTFVDIDHVIEALYYDPLRGRSEHLSCGEIYQRHGDEFFRALEKDAVRKVRGIKHGVIATGGGAVLDFANYVELKRQGLLIYLKGDRATIQERILALPQLPAYLDPNDVEGSFNVVYQSRIPMYERVADRTIDIRGLSAEEVAAEIIRVENRE